LENLVSDIKGGTYTEGISKQGDEEDIELKTDNEAGGWRKLHNEKLHNLYSLPSIIRLIMSRRM
jgi:hypothetical protein